MKVMDGYTMVNVPGKRGYSFIVKAEESEAIDFAIQHDAFECEEDAEYATTDCVTEYDYKFFKDSIVC